MIRTFTKRFLSTALSFLLVTTSMPFEAGGQQPAPTGSTGYSGQGAPLSADELQQLVAPIALYPDALVAQILGAATFPDEVAAASGWLQQNKNLTGTALMQAVDTAHRVPLGPRQPGEEPQLDFLVGRGVSHASRGCHDGSPDFARSSQGLLAI
jgi:hypothetical protein